MCVAVSTDFMKWLRLVRGEDDWMGVNAFVFSLCAVENRKKRQIPQFQADRLIFASKYNREFYFWESS